MLLLLDGSCDLALEIPASTSLECAGPTLNRAKICRGLLDFDVASMLLEIDANNALLPASPSIAE
jgi:hypothetical protein